MMKMISSLSRSKRFVSTIVDFCFFILTERTGRGGGVGLAVVAGWRRCQVGGAEGGWLA